ncbi:hypothetical protein BGZ94_005067 [Podila epigama]|nr:hypothetical protein BGZ94_005067 [Podila epigama]
MPHHLSQSSFFLSALPSSTTMAGMADSKIPGRKYSFGSIHSNSSYVSASSTSSISSCSSGSTSTTSTTAASANQHRTIGTSNSSFYNLHRDSNKSNLDLHQYPPVHPHQPHHLHLHLHHQFLLSKNTASLASSSASVLSSSASTYSGHTVYSNKSAASSTHSLASSQYSQYSQYSQFSQFSTGEPILHAIGSIPAPSLGLNSNDTSSTNLGLRSSASTSSLSVHSLNTLAKTPVLIAAVTGTPSSTAPSSDYPTRSSSSSKSNNKTVHRSASSSSLTNPTRPLLLPSAAASLCTLQIPPSRKRTVNPIPISLASTTPCDNLIPLPAQTRTSRPSTTSSLSSSSMLSSSGPNSAGLSPIDATFSEVSSTISSPATPTYHSRPFAAMSITELVISESQYRIAQSLEKATENALISASRKDTVILRALNGRWNDIVRMHSKFHDDVVAINDDLLETASLVNGLLVTLEPILIDHGRDLPGAVKKLVRRDQNSDHTSVEWESALRQPFDHLAMYDEWLQRIDPESRFTKEYRAHLSGLIYKIKMVAEANQQQQNPRNMLRRLSTMAKGVIRRRASVQLLALPAPQEAPITPTTPLSYATSDTFSCKEVSSPRSSTSSPSSPVSSLPASTAASTPTTLVPTSCLPSLPEVVEKLAIAESPAETKSETADLHGSQDTLSEQQTSASGLNDKMASIDNSKEGHVTADNVEVIIKAIEQPLVAAMLDKELPATPVEEDEVCNNDDEETQVSCSRDQSLSIVQPMQQQNRSSSAVSELSSACTLTVASSAASTHSKTSSMTATTTTTADDTPLSRQTSRARQQFLSEREARKATLRIGTHQTIQRKAESLQSPTYNKNSLRPRPSSSIETLRVPLHTHSSEKKPPVKSLISFWEQVSDPLDV